MDEPRIIIATPLRKNFWIDARTSAWVLEECQKGHRRWCMMPSDDVRTGRNAIVEDALANTDWPFTHIFWLDSDNVPQKNTLDVLLASDKPIVAGYYLFKPREVALWSYKIDGEWQRGPAPILNPEGPELFEAEQVAGSAVLVKREVYEKMTWPYYDNRIQPLGDEGRPLKIGEDCWFCEEAKKLGYQLWVHRDGFCRHFNYMEITQ